jgi:hypothetical protein
MNVFYLFENFLSRAEGISMMIGYFNRRAWFFDINTEM